MDDLSLEVFHYLLDVLNPVVREVLDEPVVKIDCLREFEDLRVTQRYGAVQVVKSIIGVVENKGFNSKLKGCFGCRFALFNLAGIC